MKFSIERDALAEAVAWAARNLPARPMAPQLAGLLIDTTDSGLVLSSFDYEVSSRVDVVAAVAEPGRVLVSGRLLSEIAKLLPAAPVVFTATCLLSTPTVHPELRTTSCNTETGGPFHPHQCNNFFIQTCKFKV